MSRRLPHRWVGFTVMNVVAFGVAGGVYVLVGRAEFLDEVSESLALWFSEHMWVSALAAATPLLVTILVGLHHVRRSARRRASAGEEEAAEVRADAG